MRTQLPLITDRYRQNQNQNQLGKKASSISIGRAMIQNILKIGHASRNGDVHSQS